MGASLCVVLLDPSAVGAVDERRSLSPNSRTAYGTSIVNSSWSRMRSRPSTTVVVVVVVRPSEARARRRRAYDAAVPSGDANRVSPWTPGDGCR
jgi:hypothetical protein